MASLQIDASKDNFTDGEIILLSGYAPLNSQVNIFLVDSYGNIENSTIVTSNSTGYFNSNLGIPLHVKGGSWSIFAKSGENNFARQVMINFHGANTPPFNFPSGLPPMKQFKLGIAPEYIQCKTDLQLIIKTENHSPACVKSQTLQKIIQREWGVLGKTIKVQNTDLSFGYSITGGIIKESKLDAQSTSLITSIETTGNGILTITIPRALLDTVKNDRGEGSFIVLADGQETHSKQINTTLTYRTFSISFANGTSTIVIIATELI